MPDPKNSLTVALQSLMNAESGLLDQRGTIRVSQAERHTRAASKQVRLALEWLREEEGECKMKWCLWCAEELRYVPGKGWLHPDGELYKTFIGADGKVRDDHCAFPTDDLAAAQAVAAEREKERAHAQA